MLGLQSWLDHCKIDATLLEMLATVRKYWWRRKRVPILLFLFAIAHYCKRCYILFKCVSTTVTNHSNKLLITLFTNHSSKLLITLFTNHSSKLLITLFTNHSSKLLIILFTNHSNKFLITLLTDNDLLWHLTKLLIRLLSNGKESLKIPMEGQTIQWPKGKDRQHNGQKKKNTSTIIYKTLHRKLKIGQHEPH
jgi:hypothetical protein